MNILKKKKLRSFYMGLRTVLNYMDKSQESNLSEMYLRYTYILKHVLSVKIHTRTCTFVCMSVRAKQ